MSEMNTPTYQALSPWADADAVPLQGIAERLTVTPGLRIGIFQNCKRAARLAADAVEKHLGALLEGATFTRYQYTSVNVPELQSAGAEAFRSWLQTVDAVVLCVADCGSCTKYLIHDAVSIELLGKPTATLVNEGFLVDGRSAASAKGMPVLRTVAQTMPCECSSPEDADAAIGAVAARILETLSQPRTPEEAQPRPRARRNESGAVFEGDLAEFNRFFYRRGWGDGLPLVPPTDQAVRAMLEAVDLPPDHVVGQMEPRRGKATVEKIAINAVMAGALPIHMPLIVACVETTLDPVGKFGTFNVSTGSWSPFWMINGPVRKDVGLNCRSGALSPGTIANAAIGRAMGLIIKNIGGARPGVEDMGVLGNPMKYSSVIGENEEESPWAPLHVQQGLAAEDSAVTVFFPNSYSQLWPYQTTDKGILDAIIYNLQPGRGGLHALVLPPSLAATLGKAGWSKEMIQGYVAEFARVPAYRHRSYWDTGTVFNRKGTVPNNPMDSVSIVKSPSHVRVMVAGGPGAFMGIASGAFLDGNSFVTRKIHLPKNWTQLVERYRNHVPAYEAY